MRTLSTPLFCAAVASACAATGDAPPGEAEQTLAGLTASAGTYAPMADPPAAPLTGSSEFETRFRLMAHVSLPMNEVRSIGVPEFCAVGADGSVYFASMGSPDLGVWRPDGRVHRLELGGAPARTMAIATREGDEAVYVLDAARQQVRRYSPDGEPLDYVPLNAGQISFSLVVLPDGGIVTGGLRREREDRTTLLALHSATGRLVRAFFPMSDTTLGNKLRVAPPVHVVSAGDGTLIAAQSGSPRLHRFGPDGEELGSFGSAYEGYRPQVVVTETVADAEQTRALLAAWDPLVFLHQARGVSAVGFETRSGGRRVWRLEVYGPSGERESTGLLHPAQPLCGDARHLVLVGQPAGGATQLFRYAFPGEPHGGRPPSSSRGE